MVLSLAVSLVARAAYPPLVAPDLLVLALHHQVADLAQQPEASFPVEASLEHGTLVATMYGRFMAQYITDMAETALVMATVLALLAFLLADMPTVLSETTSAITATGAASVAMVMGSLPPVCPGALRVLEVLEPLRLLWVLSGARAQQGAPLQLQELVELPVLAALANHQRGNKQPSSPFLATLQKPN
ncbi:uncharacterized protein LOC119461409 isoform X2 [Dermacentor silvarum]|uniref:uncharacterized protein LOC119461409 isoform X2 n=1 Tax=Dermacentor silvarum TaxID=543639 RepID=UPI002100B332|nr:uncharacterized protein LOC119461409 isoform X2 [Dermacentor silvarum]